MPMGFKEDAPAISNEHPAFRTGQNGPRVTDGHQDRDGFFVARTVEFVVRPGKTEELHKALETVLGPALAWREGFLGLLVMNPRKEPRLVSLLTFWQAGGNTTDWCWEELTEGRDVLEPLLERAPRVQTMEVRFSSENKLPFNPGLLSVC